jgi:hypothetical protein
MEYIAEAHAVAVGQPSGTHDMTCEVNGPLTVWQDRLDANPVSILDLEIVSRVSACRQMLCVVIGKSYRHALMVGVNSFDPDVAERSRRGKSARVLDD